MAIDPQIEQAIKVSVREAKQSDSLADKLIAWINAINNGNEKINDQSAAARRLELIYEDTVLNLKED